MREYESESVETADFLRMLGVRASALVFATDFSVGSVAVNASWPLHDEADASLQARIVELKKNSTICVPFRTYIADKLK